MSQPSADERSTHTRQDPQSKHVVWIEFEEDDDTRYNFSPTLGETAAIKVRKHPEGIVQGYDFKMDIVRLLKNDGSQLIDVLDVEPSNPDYVTARGTDFNQLLLTWNGIPGDPGYVGPTENPQQAEGPDEFIGVNSNFNRMLPKVTLGQPAPPPLYYARSVIFESGNPNNEYHVAYHPIYVPQVVLLELDENAAEELMNDHYNPLDSTQLLVEGFIKDEVDALLNDIKSSMLEAYGDDVNMRVVTTTEGLEGKYSTITIRLGESPGTPFGLAAQTDFGNISIDDDADVFVLPPRKSFKISYGHWVSGIRDPLIEPVPPMTVSEQVFCYSRTSTHEQGHLLGLVKDNGVLEGHYSHNSYEINPNDTNPYSYPFRYMNAAQFVGEVDGEVVLTYKATIEERIGRDGDCSWRDVNEQYLKFILPSP